MLLIASREASQLTDYRSPISIIISGTCADEYLLREKGIEAH